LGLVNKVKTAARLIKQGNFREMRIRTASLLKKRKIIKKGGLAVSAVTLIVTHKCTLRCRNCAALIHHFKSPQTMPREQVFRDVGLLMDKIDYTHILLLVGGEIFLLDNIAEYVSRVLEYKDKFGLIVITTNGTIMPSDEELAGLAKFRKYINIEISDYEGKSVYLKSLQEKLRRHKISCKINNEEWREWQQIIDEQDDEYAKNNYKNCLAAVDSNFLLCDGKLYHCGFLASGATLRSMPYSPGNHVDLLDAGTTRADIIKYKSPGSVPPGCKHCGGYAKDAAFIKKAEQLSEPREYKIYE